MDTVICNTSFVEAMVPAAKQEKEMEFTVFQYRGLWKDFREIMVHGSKCFKYRDFFDYECIATIEAADLDEVFRIGQREHPRFASITRHNGEKFWGISVGDIIMNLDSEFFMVDPLGFTQISVPSVREIIQHEREVHDPVASFFWDRTEEGWENGEEA